MKLETITTEDILRALDVLGRSGQRQEIINTLADACGLTDEDTTNLTLATDAIIERLIGAKLINRSERGVLYLTRKGLAAAAE